MTDQQRADLRKSCGYELDTMPFLDEWAQGGVEFGRAYTPNPTCTPARVSLFTGRYSQCHRVRTNHNAKDAFYTGDILDVLKNQGYTTALCGKNHTHHADDDFDFHEVTWHLGEDCDANASQKEKEFAAFLDNTKYMEVHTPAPGGIEIQHPYRNVSSALNFIDSRKEDQPFFVWVSFAEPHNPYQVPEPYFDMFPPDVLPEIHGTTRHLQDKGERFTWIRGVWEKVLGEDIENRILRSRSNYHGMLRLIDDQIKRLIEGLRERNLEEDTIVIFVSDHGDFAGEYGLIRKGTDLPDVLCHIPMIWRGPGIAPQEKNHTHYTNLVDILPTICHILGVETPYGCQGRSMVPLLENKDIPEKEFDTAFSESGFSGLYWNDDDGLTLPVEDAVSEQWDRFDCLNTWTQCGQVRAIWKNDFHIQVDMMGRGYLYNLKNDPYELENLWNDPEYLEIKTELLTELMAAVLKASDPIPVPHSRYRTKIHPRGYWNQTWRCEDMGVRDITL